MIQFLAKHLIKNYQDITSPPVRRAYGVLCGCVGVALNLLLFEIGSASCRERV